MPQNCSSGWAWDHSGVIIPFQRRNQPVAGDNALGGVARVDARTKNLTKRLRTGEIAVIDHADIDRVSA